ncbi:MAG: hypothetical protein BGN97_08520 [Microbacterium sp. 69-10]|mgnify:CR=1 FL=1|uniref:GTPase family protein n=1 Tax=Microbacterium sp. 69-10 TaxID=1895783 RepID=UPI00096113BC|nr:GTPase domain-containing protein [Microbacterium sp. 69-10]OJU41695.1 MAG: hypothetical protein BGN97_08520 [Microbacterium sp. 69-10]
MSEDWATEEFRKKWQEQADEIGRFNLAIFGKTGVGKSTLINAVFGETVAPTGIGEPVTMSEHLYLHNSGFLGLLDTRGLEIGRDTNKLIAELGTYVKQMRKGPLVEQVHVAWYCVRSADRRFEATEADFIRRLHELDLPVVVVLTQVPSREGNLHPDSLEIARHIETLDLPIVGGRVYPVMAQGDEFSSQPQHGLQELLDATFRVAPEGVRVALTAAQKVDLARKRAQANKAVLIAAGAAGTVGLVAGADYRLQGITQLVLTAKIAAIYGIDQEVAAVAAAAAGAAIGVGVDRATEEVAKRMSDGGEKAQGTVTAISLGAFTLAVGYAWMAVCDQLAQGKLQGLDGILSSEGVRAIFLARFEVAVRDTA